MTKRVIISIVLLLIAVSLSVSSFFLLQKKMSALGEALENAIYTDLPITQANAEIQKCWKSDVTVFHIFLLHSDVSQLQTELESLSALKDRPEVFHLTCIRSLYLLRGIREGLLLSADNII